MSTHDKRGLCIRLSDLATHFGPFFPSPPQYGEGEADQQGAETAPCTGEVGTYTTSYQYPLTLGSCRCLYSRTAEKENSRRFVFAFCRALRQAVTFHTPAP